MPSKAALVSSPMQPTLAARYVNKTQYGHILFDQAQAQAVDVLDRLARQIHERENATVAGTFWARLTKARSVSVDGVYLVGDVGRGKSMLMDMFYEYMDIPGKRRVHFHAFMQEMHQALAGQHKQSSGTDDPVTALAARIAKQYSLICFDEFQMHDMSDAVVILRLLNALIDAGTVFVVTSNTEPDKLLQHHLGREAVIPYIRRFASHMQLVRLRAARDYRRDREENKAAWITPADADAHARLDTVFSSYAVGPAAAARVKVGSRVITVPTASGPVARFCFDDLCGKPLGANDYLALAGSYGVLIVDDIPRMSPENYDKARRFITLIDILYEHRICLFASAACEANSLYEAGENARIFERTASRLEEMRSRTWFAARHI
ncbi:putative ATPase [Neoasaia chiangmaiensis NBRC 101099]|uniref:Uncharacterized protein n=1 Tax=Neoasaia chiangmaiensis TaxID=320497 RepID=A0A1U9KLX2_9PROT|nr:cell division protein ZapE [Neoasaia chiangmaiensis]AQS86797.1 hypothetical protein A0U93_01200 [Neoasaia chiangmaiensis]GBR35412.1 putative ATPase [Neoasaia chiangmaiensis NBRC 101099]GEN16341.1 cell division protein ZapE [Neoasaia chiangmaiensis]